MTETKETKKKTHEEELHEIFEKYELDPLFVKELVEESGICAEMIHTYLTKWKRNNQIEKIDKKGKEYLYAPRGSRFIILKEKYDELFVANELYRIIFSIMERSFNKLKEKGLIDLT